MENKKEIVLSVKNLSVNFSTDHGYVQAVRGVSFDLYRGETLCIVGESGSGKSVTSKTIMGILASNGRIAGGSIMYEGEDLTKVSEDEFHRIRGHKIGMIFQDPLSSLNPIVRIGKQITEAMLINSSRIKRYYEDLISEELVAYKNAQTELKTGLAKYTEYVRFLKAERRKDVSKAHGSAQSEIKSRLYTLRLSYGANIFKVGEEHDVKVIEAKNKLAANKISEEQFKTELASLNEAKDVEIAKIKEQYSKDKADIKAKYPELKEKAKQAVEETKAKYDQKIEDALSNATEEKAALKAKYKPLIAEAKLAYKAKCKEAKIKVKEYEARLKDEHLKNVEKIKAECIEKYGENAKNHIKVELKKENDRYISQLRITKAEAKARALKIMKEVGISEPEKRFKQYPFEFSGGMRQRIVIAIALTADPDIIICDEPTTALDVTIQAQILELINRLKKERNLSCIFITHDLGVVANMADRVAVMYAGKIVEYGTEDEIFYDPRHPYTWALLASIPDIDSNEKLEAIPGTPPNMIYPPIGDAFALRSKYAMAIDFKKEPPLFKVSDTHYAATWLLDPRAPKVEMPKIVKTRIENSLKASKKGGK